MQAVEQAVSELCGPTPHAEQALDWKGIPYDLVPVNLLQGEQREETCAPSYAGMCSIALVHVFSSTSDTIYSIWRILTFTGVVYSI